MTTQITIGRFPRGSGSVHIAVPYKKVTTADGKVWTLFRPKCRRITFRNVTNLMETVDGHAVTCKKCASDLPSEYTTVSLKN